MFVSVFLDPGLRKAMGDQAVALAKAVNYDSAGETRVLTLLQLWLIMLAVILPVKLVCR